MRGRKRTQCLLLSLQIEAGKEKTIVESDVDWRVGKKKKVGKLWILTILVG